jgi:peptide deformylase
MELEIVKGPDQRLITKCGVFDFNNPSVNPVEFALSIAKLMRDKEGLGLAANQVGYEFRAFVMRTDPNTVAFNPRIVNIDGPEIVMVEGCLSYPGMIVKIKRKSSLRLRYQEPNGETVSKTYTGLAARIVQHELDHLDGVLFFNRASKYHRDQGIRKWNLAKRNLIEKHKPPELDQLEKQTRESLCD